MTPAPGAATAAPGCNTPPSNTTAQSSSSGLRTGGATEANTCV